MYWNKSPGYLVNKWDVLLNHAPWLISIYRNHTASYLVPAKRDHTNSTLFIKLLMLPFIPWGWGSIFLAIVTSSYINVTLQLWNICLNQNVLNIMNFWCTVPVCSPGFSVKIFSTSASSSLFCGKFKLFAFR